MTLSVSQKLISELRKNGIEQVFFVAGGNAMYLNEAIRESDMVAVPVHHEQSAAIAAEAYSRVSAPKVGMCLVTSGPGVTNLVTGLAGAYLDSTPMVAIIGQAKSELESNQRTNFLRQSGLFEVDNEAILKPVIKKFFRCTSSTNIESLAVEALEIARGDRPGPVVIQVALGEQSAAAAASGTVKNFIQKTSKLRISEIKKISKAIESSRFEKPLILLGHGVLAAGNSKHLRALAERFQIPVVSTQLAKAAIHFNHPLFIGHPGPRGDRAANYAVQNADLLICVGTSLSTQTIGYEVELFSPGSVKVIQDLGRGVSEKNLKISKSFYVDLDVRNFLNELSECWPGSSGSIDTESWIGQLHSRKQSFSVSKEPHKKSPDGHNMYHFVDELSEALMTFDGKAHIVTDAGLAFYIMGQAFKLAENHTYTVSGGLGSMGFALPALVGLSTVSSDALCVAVSGDGSTQMNVQEFATLGALGAKAIYFLINNDGYASIRNTQDSFFDGRIGSSVSTGVTMPSWRGVAESYGINYRKIAASDNLRSSIHECLFAEKPMLVEVICQSKQVVIPSVPNYVDSSGALRSSALDQMAPSQVERETQALSFN